MKKAICVLIMFFKINSVYALVINKEDPVYYFVNHEKMIHDLKKKLNKTKLVAVTGVTGIGKSELVRMFVKKYQQEYKIIIFIDTNINFVPQFIDIAKQINGKLCKEGLCVSENPLQVKTSLMQYLKSQKNWLMIFDGLKINENDKVQEFINWKHSGHIIICSQDIEHLTHRISASNLHGNNIKSVIDEIIEGRDENFKKNLSSSLEGYPTYLVARSAIFLNNNNHMTIDEYMVYMQKHNNKTASHLELILKEIPKRQQEILFKLVFINNQKIPKKVIDLLLPNKEECISFIHNMIRFGVLEQVNNDRNNMIFRMHDSLKNELIKTRNEQKIKNDINVMLDLINDLMPESVTDRLAILKNNSLLEGNIEIILKNAKYYSASGEKMIKVGEKLLWYYLLGSRQISSAKNLVEWFKIYDKAKLPLKTDIAKVSYANFLVYVAGFEYSISNVAPEIAINYLDRAENLIKGIKKQEELAAYIYATKAHIQIAIGDFNQASVNVIKAEKVKPKILRTYLGSNVTKHLKSRIYLEQGNYEKALELVSNTIDNPNAVNTKSHKIKNIEDRHILLAPEYITKAKILNYMTKYSEAFALVNDNVYQHIKDGNTENFDILLARTLVEMARAKNGLKSYDDALYFIKNSLKIFTKNNDLELSLSNNLNLANALFVKANILCNKGDYNYAM